MEIHSIFVYGSLKRSYLRSAVWPHPPVSVQEGVIRARLFDLGPYPAIALHSEGSDANDCVLGELWTLTPEHIVETLAVLDSVEGYVPSNTQNEYIRRVVLVNLADEVMVDAFVYEYADVLRLVSFRRIGADRDFGGMKVAAWPDYLARVPNSFNDE